MASNIGLLANSAEMKNFDFWNSWGGIIFILVILVIIILNGVLGTGAWDNMPY